MSEVFSKDGRLVSPTGVLSDLEIKHGLEIGHIICDPEPVKINGSSVDVTLGHYFYKASGPNGGGLFNPFDEASVREYYGEFLEAKPWDHVRRKIAETAIADIDEIKNIPEDHPVIVLRPNERILAHTHEFIGILPPGTTQMQARSTTGRLGISACYCAGWGDPGYINRWTMEVHNLNENYHVVLPVGYPLAQIVFSMTGPVETEYSKSTGNYQSTGSDDLAATKAAWHPEQMLPKSYKSGFTIPQKIEGLSGDFK